MGTLAEYMFRQFSWVQYAEFFLRIVAAGACGAAIGLERSLRMKEAGFRTHIIVCAASALMMIVSKYGFVDLTIADSTVLASTRGADAARIAAGVVTGVSFLGAGIIFRNGNTIKGLTTAAGIWATAGIGLAMGCGMYIIGFFSTLAICLLQYLTHKFVFGADAMTTYKLSFTVKGDEKLHQTLLDTAKEKKMNVLDSTIRYLDGGFVNYTLTLKTRCPLTAEKVRLFLKEQGELKLLSFVVMG